MPHRSPIQLSSETSELIDEGVLTPILGGIMIISGIEDAE